MPIRMKKRLTSLFSLALCGGTVVLLYHNCAPQEGSSSFDGAPFAWDVRIDTLAYMSCEGMSSGHDPMFYTFMAAAHRPQSGLKLRAEFVADAGSNNIRNGAYNVISDSKMNSAARMQLALRQKADLNLFVNNFSAQGRPTSNYTTGLADPRLLATVFKNFDLQYNLPANQQNLYSNFFPLVDPETTPNRVEATISFVTEQKSDSPLNISPAELIRGFFSSLTPEPKVLAVTFLPSDGIDPALPPISETAGSPLRKAFGRGFQMEFAAGYGMIGNPNQPGANKNRIVATRSEINGTPSGPAVVREFDLTGDGTFDVEESNKWFCPDTLKFMIVRANDNNFTSGGSASQRCATNEWVTYNPNSSAETQAFQIVKQALPIDKWYVNITENCVVPRITVPPNSCYGTLPSGVTPSYYGEVCGTTAKDPCPHYISLCYKKL
jgi:hypothetical protein